MKSKNLVSRKIKLISTDKKQKVNIKDQMYIVEIR